MSDFSLDENGKLSDSDPFYDKLDEWHDGGDFDRVISAVLEIPREEWSCKLHFRLISAYNNKKDFDSARDELEKLRPSCKSPQDLSKFYYMNGYIYFMTDREMLALSLFKLGIEADPGNTSGLDLENECRDCLDYIEEDLANLHSVSEEAVQKLAARCAETPDKIEADDPSFAVQLGFLFSVRILPGMTQGIGVSEFFKEYDGEEREAVLKCLAEKYTITDRKSLLEFIRKDRYCNLAAMVNDVMASLTGKPNFDIEILNPPGREAFENAKFFVRPFAEFLPRAGVLAWDINEKNGLVRYAYSCGIIGREDYVAAMIALSDSAKENFSSAEEYLRSLIFGCAMYAFDVDSWNINGAVDFIEKMLPLLLQSALPDIKWKKPEKRNSVPKN